MRLEDLRRTCTVAILFFNDGNNELINYNQSRSDAPTVMIHPPIRPLLAQERKTISKIIIPGLLFFFLSIVVWILSITARMSKNIHDDHSSLWVAMDDTSILHEWYDELDVCLLSSQSVTGMNSNMTTDGYSYNNSAIRRHHNKNGQLRSGLQFQKIQLADAEINWSNSCAVELRASRKEFIHKKGDNTPSFCHLSHSARPFHRKQLNSKLLRSPRQSLRQYLFRLAEDEHALVFIGDTVTRQVRDGGLSGCF